MEEREFKILLSATKVKANKKLKDQILHQIKAEKELVPTQQSQTSKIASSHFSVLGMMYLSLLILTGYFYMKTGGELLQSKAFILSALMLSSLFSIYWFITVYDDYKKSKPDPN